ncbi:MAG TPA: hypothetical protein VK901_12155, partial [Nitrospiraceae bacterium]|nr:hypothetical protein [Nitrospiraceae bacterium]
MKLKRRILLAVLGLLIGWGGAGMAQAVNTVTFDAQDAPGSWFKCSGMGCVLGIPGQQSLAVIAPGDSVAFSSTGQANTIHTAVSLMFPTGAAGMPFDVDLET